MRVLGLDVGDRRIGVAMSDPLGLTAQPLTVIQRRSPTVDANTIRELIERHGVTAVVVGLPLTLDGTRGPQAKKVQGFIDTLRRHIALPIEWVDERLTTVQGERALREGNASRARRKQVIDQVAAQLILQQFLDRHRAMQ